MDRSTEYMYASARVRFMEMKMPGKDILERMMAARSGQEARALLADLGVDREGELDAALTGWLEGCFSAVVSSTEDKKIADFLRYPYDANNIKALIKGYLRSVNVEDTLSSLGTLPVDAIRYAVENRDVSGLPKLSMAAALLPAMEETAKTGDPQKTDMWIDAACFRDMKEAVKGRSDFVRDMVTTQIDTVNLMTALRTLRMWRNNPCFEPKDFLLEGGTISIGDLMNALKEGNEGVLRLMSRGRYEKLCTELSDHLSLGAMERAMDNFRMEEIRRAVYIPFGEEVLLGYLAGCEAAAKNIRILMAGKNAGLGSDKIRERMRISYV